MKEGPRADKNNATYAKKNMQAHASSICSQIHNLALQRSGLHTVPSAVMVLLQATVLDTCNPPLPGDRNALKRPVFHVLSRVMKRFRPHSLRCGHSFWKCELLEKKGVFWNRGPQTFKN